MVKTVQFETDISLILDIHQIYIGKTRLNLRQGLSLEQKLALVYRKRYIRCGKGRKNGFIKTQLN